MSHESDAAVQRATGFLELGLAEEALSELDDLPAGLREDSLILHLRVDCAGDFPLVQREHLACVLLREISKQVSYDLT